MSHAGEGLAAVTADRMLRDRPGIAPDLTADAVVVLPGIMGSVLEDSSGRTLWGLSGRALARAWSRRDGLDGLRVTDADREDKRAGAVARVRATRLLHVPAWAPFFKGFEPYRDLLRTVQETTLAPAAVLAFPYDWRLPVARNAVLLATAARNHLDSWRDHLAANRGSRAGLSGAEPRLVFVAHSMGGLVAAAALANDPGLAADTRAVVTLGTPFHGSALAALILGTGEGVPALPKRRLRAIATTMPGLYDLLPGYRCVDEGGNAAPRRLDAADVRALGGSEELAKDALAYQPVLRAAGQALPGHHAVIGVAQATAQSVHLDNGQAGPIYTAFLSGPGGELRYDADGVPMRVNRYGDGTVYRDSAHSGAPGLTPTHVPVQHGALAKHSAVLEHVRAVLTGHAEQVGPPLGAGDIGLDVPDDVQAGETCTVEITGSRTAAGITCTVTSADTGRQIDAPRIVRRGDGLGADVVLPDPGLYRVTLDTGGTAPVTQLVLALTPGGDAVEPS